MRTMMEVDYDEPALHSSREAVLSLMQTKASIEAEILELQNYLTQQVGYSLLSVNQHEINYLVIF